MKDFKADVSSVSPAFKQNAGLVWELNVWSSRLILPQFDGLR